MNKIDEKTLKNNPKIDKEVLVSAEKLNNKMPDGYQPKQGSDYNITPALGGNTISMNLLGRKV